MTVKELIERLQTLDQDKLVVLSRDEEGNGYSSLAQVDDNFKYNDWDKEIGISVLTPDMERQGYTEEDVAETGEECVVLYP